MKNLIESMPWGTFEGEPVTRWRLVNANGLELHFTNWGGRLLKALVPDRCGCPCASWTMKKRSS